MRFSDERLSERLGPDFVPRHYSSVIWALVVAYAIALCLIIGINIFIVSNGNDLLGISAIIIVIGALAFYSILQKQRNLDLVHATEFENALLSGAAAVGSRFYLIIRGDGTVVYSSYGLRLMFPQFHANEERALDSLFEAGGVMKVDRDRIYDALYHGASDRLIFPLRDDSGRDQEFIITVEPMERPAGYFVLKGREFVPSRQEAAPAEVPHDPHTPTHS